MAETYTVTVEPLGSDIECRADQPILDACLRAGIWLPHACTHGTCGTCKAEILDGDVDYGDASSFALMDFERDEGKALLCCATPRSDVTIEGDVEIEDGVTMHPVGDYVGTVIELSDCATDTRRLVLQLDRELLFNPGQYVSLEVPDTGQTRTYSMANTPAETDRVELHIRRTPGGLATDGWVFKSLTAGSKISLSGPFGRFFFRPARSEPMIMIAGGTGLAPIKSIVTHALAETDQRILLYVGGRTPQHLYDVEHFRQLEAQHPDRLIYRPCLSEDTVDGFATGMVTDVLDAELETAARHVAYVCGPPPMVDAAVKMLMRKRLFPRDIFREDFFDASDKATGGVRSPLLKR
ncbi:NADH:ubiquinone reductase (Na(+)-transporting) subunit F [Mycolicibacterium sp.]|uniref:NADH:ubiquinone reductase (Na(+)-transporting) subunit F n=1 Tax=Mycolicibacterium sp. TaxID=2320850 RepID=UPI0037C55CAC